MARVGLPPGVRRALTFWRRSIQARVVASTLVLSSLVISGVGWFLLTSTKDGLLDHRVDAVLAEADATTDEARTRLEAASGTEVNAGRQQRELADQIIARGETRGFSVVLGVPAGDGARLSDGGPEYTPGLDLVSVPDSLQGQFEETAPMSWTYTKIVTNPLGDEVAEEPGIVVGSQVVLPSDGKTYTFYFLFPLDEERETLALVTRALLTAAIALLVLVAGITWLVARQVVTPIRMARRVAERLAAGRLQERLRVSGEDDLARLATSFNQMASNLQRQIRQLEELSRVQRRFVSDVSHELRTPLTTVRMAGDVLHDARASFDPVTARAAELLQVELDRFEVLLADLLEISRFDAGAAVLEADDINLLDVAHRVVDSTRALAEQRGVRVVIEPPANPCLAEADVRRVERIMRNLVTNAIDHADTRLGDEIKVLLACDDQAAAIAVRDYGVGLAPGESAMVFNRFWRADPARARTSGGTGLGLSIALEDTHLHGGWLQAWGRPGRGAQFRLTLPRRAGEPLRHSPLPLVPADADEPVAEVTR
ncbi:two-component sensor histidine kinase [Nocardioides szechwanensis]|uniref:Sensor histidine kinase MtrB n=1 Tax=Nocardioides szechwanensis TaxID=1005944 RepID=A0A1H0L6W7_9ACTN|nr:MtrAB system histidine kinase MtrB [Nocardioides szechwanensis]GEP35625.1 two-component sensor histidine kinase [Nocardioides szechwanensis]SDO63968.1 two-component system, OmpR family, sensor histidine kinase MtrB [Nocardioides szechwanensis]